MIGIVKNVRLHSMPSFHFELGVVFYPLRLFNIFMQTTLFVISSLKDGLVMGDDPAADHPVEDHQPKEPKNPTADLHVEDHQPKEPKNPTADLPQEEAHAAKGNSELKAADVAANFQAKWLKDLKGDLTEEAKSESNQDLRRAQLTARAK